MAYFDMMTDLQDELMGLEDEFSRLQESINKSRSKATRDSGLPESMRNSTEDQDYLEQGARPKNIRTDTIENQRPESPLDPDRRVDRMTDRPYLLVHPIMQIYPDMITIYQGRVMLRLAGALVQLEQTSLKVVVLSQTNMMEIPRGLTLSPTLMYVLN